MKLWIFDKEECLLGLVKQLTQILSDWDSDTEEMIAKLRDTRNEQVSIYSGFKVDVVSRINNYVL